MALPRLPEIEISYRALAALTAAGLVIECGVGLVPLLLMRHLTAIGSLRTGHETASRPALRLRSALIVGQTSFAFLLVATATLLGASLKTVLAQPLGFETKNVVTLRVVSLAVRTANSPMHTATTVRQLLRKRDPRLAVFSVATTADLVTSAVATRRLLLWLVSGFAVIGVVIALIGLYGTVAYMVAQRTRELGVRLALGATTSQIRRLVLQRGLLLVAAGIALGSAGTFVLRRGIEAQLFGITAMNAPAIAGALRPVIVVELCGPALRATRINPVDALRAE